MNRARLKLDFTQLIPLAAKADPTNKAPWLVMVLIGIAGSWHPCLYARNASNQEVADARAGFALWGIDKFTTLEVVPL